jgi:hypothetical protein
MTIAVHTLVKDRTFFKMFFQEIEESILYSTLSDIRSSLNSCGK